MITFTTITNNFKDLNLTTFYNNENINPMPKGDIDKVMIIAKNKDSEIVGLVSVSIYSESTLSRKSVWRFGANAERSAWIDRIDSHVKGLGRELLGLAKEWVLARLYLCIKKNLYVASLHTATNFYRRCGYIRIDTDTDSCDEDSLSVYEIEIANIMALPLLPDLSLDKEISMYSNCKCDYYKLNMVSQGEPDKDNVLSKAFSLFKNNDNDYHYHNDYSYLLFNCLIFKHVDDKVIYQLIAASCTFSWFHTYLKEIKKGEKEEEKEMYKKIEEILINIPKIAF